MYMCTIESLGFAPDNFSQNLAIPSFTIPSRDRPLIPQLF
jgi:hypothetical protein